MNTIKGYMVRMWTSDGKINNEKFFSACDLLHARKEAFHYAQNLSHVMNEARKAGVIDFDTAEEILNPEKELDDIVIGNVFISVVYEDKTNDLVQTDEDIIHMIICDEADLGKLTLEDEKLAHQKLEVFDPFDPEAIRVRNKEAWFYIREGGFDLITVINAGTQAVLLLMDDYLRLKEKDLIPS
jgi:hypothetical protein